MKSGKKKKVYGSAADFARQTFPKSQKKRLSESMDLNALAVSLANESLKKIERTLKE